MKQLKCKKAGDVFDATTGYSYLINSAFGRGKVFDTHFDYDWTLSTHVITIVVKIDIDNTISWSYPVFEDENENGGLDDTKVAGKIIRDVARKLKAM